VTPWPLPVAAVLRCYLNGEKRGRRMHQGFDLRQPGHSRLCRHQSDARVGTARNCIHSPYIWTKPYGVPEVDCTAVDSQADADALTEGRYRFAVVRLLSACANRAVDDLCNEADGNGQSNDSVETSLTAAVCFA